MGILVHTKSMYNESKCDTHTPCIGVTWSLFSDLALNLAPSGLFGCSLKDLCTQIH